MNRLYVALFTLLAVLFGSLFQAWRISSIIDTTIEPLTQSKPFVLQEDYHTVERLLAESHNDYLEEESYLCAFVSEKLLDEVRLSYARSEASVKAKDSAQLLSEIAALEQSLDDVRRTEVFSFQNIF